MKGNLQSENRTRRGFIVSALGSCLLLLLGGAAFSGRKKQRFTINILAGHLPGGSQTIKVTQGDVVEIEFISDQTLSLHLHGLNVKTDVTPGHPAVMSFNARFAGRFPIEVHGKGAHGNLMYVEIYP